VAKKAEVASLPDPDKQQSAEMKSVVVAASDAVRLGLYRVWYRKSAATTYYTIGHQCICAKIGLTGKSAKLKCIEFST